jgi:hypothetical protein
MLTLKRSLFMDDMILHNSTYAETGNIKIFTTSKSSSEIWQPWQHKLRKNSNRDLWLFSFNPENLQFSQIWTPVLWIFQLLIIFSGGCCKECVSIQAAFLWLSIEQDERRNWINRRPDLLQCETLKEIVRILIFVECILLLYVINKTIT